jgi:hypothetical protein
MKIRKYNLASAVFSGIVGFWDLYLSLLAGPTTRGTLLAGVAAFLLALTAINGVLAFSDE